MSDPVTWLLESDEPWTRYGTLVHLQDRPQDDRAVQATRAEMLAHPLVQKLISSAGAWPGNPLRRHNDATHAIHKLTTLADFGLCRDDPGMATAVGAVLSHTAPEGALQSVVQIPRAFGGTDEEKWTWMLCDAPSLLYAMVSFGLGDDPRVGRAADHLASLVQDNGYRCTVAPELGKFRGPGRRSDPCPVANLLAAKALAQAPGWADSVAARRAAEVLLWHWENGAVQRPFLFGVGTDFRKLKYPFVWYDILHVVEVLSRLPHAYSDPRFREMVAAVVDQADNEGRYTAGSMYRAWQGWSFADKKQPSPWLTFVVLRLRRRLAGTP